MGKNEQIWSALEKSLKDFKYQRQNPKVSRNKNRKTISVSHFFDHDRLQVKIIANYDTWYNLWDRCLRNDLNVKFEDIRSSFSRRTPNYVVLELEKYNKQAPEIFAEDFYFNFIEPSMDMNPILSKKMRGGSPYGLNKACTWEIKNAARYVYVLLQRWKKQPKTQYPEVLLAILRGDDIINPRKQTKEIIEDFLRISELTKDENDFYDKYIAFQRLDHLKKAFRKESSPSFSRSLFYRLLRS